MFCAFLKTMLPVNSVLNRIAQDMELCQHGQSVGAYEERDHQQPHAVTDGIHEDDEQTEEAENGGGDAEDAAGQADNEHEKPCDDGKHRKDGRKEDFQKETHIINYAKTRDIYAGYRKAGYSKKYLTEHEGDILLHKAAKNAFDELGVKKLPSVKSLQEEYAKLLSEKKAADSNAWGKVLRRVGGDFEILAGHVDEHLEDIASIGLKVGAAAIVIGAAGFVIGVIGAQPTAVLSLVKAGGTLAVVGGGTAMAAGAVAAVSGFLQTVTGTLKKTLDGIELNDLEAEGRIQSGLTNTLYGVMTMMVGKIVYGFGQFLLNAYELQKSAEEKTRRPTWKESEDYVCEKENIPKEDRQKAFLNGHQTKNNVRLPGCSVPDGVNIEKRYCMKSRITI